MKKNLKALLMKTTESLGDGTKKKISSFINKSFSKSHTRMVRD